jgi:negative regulator of sigma-B (phosphoserine phosphatase)
MGPAHMKLLVGSVCVPATNETHCGDAFCVVEREHHSLVAVIDGLGHGSNAAEASQLAVAHIQANVDDPLLQLLEGLHQALRKTRGAVISLARIEHDAGEVFHAGIGNVETRLVGSDKVNRPIVVKGIVGYQWRKPTLDRYAFEHGDLLVMHTDGISDGFELRPSSRNLEPGNLATQLHAAHAKPADDQTLVVVRLGR